MRTAVELLVEQLKHRSIDLNKWNSDLIEQAKAMEKQQLNDAYNADRPNLTCYEENTAFNEYYNETFKK